MGKCVEIEMKDDGTFSVAECEPKAEAVPGEEQGEPTGQSFPDVKSALMSAGQMLMSAGNDEAKAGIQAGYDKVANPSGKPMFAGVPQ